jgi:GPI-anchor transamidase subunit T
MQLINVDKPLNLHVSLPQNSNLPIPASSQLTVSRWLTGHGQERGGLQVLLKNTSPSPREVVYLESLPWFMKPYLHTLTGTVNGRPIPLHKIRYRPAIDRLRGTQMEVQLIIPANSILSLTWEFDKSILRYTEYPPDANRGFDVP